MGTSMSSMRCVTLIVGVVQAGNISNPFLEDQRQLGSKCAGLCGDCLISMWGEDITTDAVPKRIIYTNGVPNHNYHVAVKGSIVTDGATAAGGNVRGAPVCEQLTKVELVEEPAAPTAVVADRLFKDTPSSGPIGYMLTGAALFNHGTATKVNFATDYALDSCEGVTDNDCQYHYKRFQGTEKCTTDCAASVNCAHIGYMLDGYKIYAKCEQYDSVTDTGSNELTSCYAKVADTDLTESDVGYYECSSTGTTVLDAANGFHFTDQNYPSGAAGTPEDITGYGYVMSADYPFVPIKQVGDSADVVIMEQAAWDALVEGTTPTISANFETTASCADAQMANSLDAALGYAKAAETHWGSFCHSTDGLVKNTLSTAGASGNGVGGAGDGSRFAARQAAAAVLSSTLVVFMGIVMA